MSETEDRVRVVRWRYGGHRWELPVRFDAYKKWLQQQQDDDDDGDDGADGGGTIPEATLTPILLSDIIFRNCSQRFPVRNKDMQETFPRRDFASIVSEILRKGEIVESQADREKVHRREDEAVERTALVAFHFLMNRFSGVGLELEDFRTDPDVKNLLHTSVRKYFQLVPPPPEGAAENDDLWMMIWRFAAHIARESADALATRLSAATVRPVGLALTWRVPAETKSTSSSSSSSSSLEQARAAVAALKKHVESTWAPLVHLAGLAFPEEQKAAKKQKDDRHQEAGAPAAESADANEEEREEEGEEEEEEDLPFMVVECLVQGHLSVPETPPAAKAVAAAIGCRLDFMHRFVESCKEFGFTAGGIVMNSRIVIDEKREQEFVARRFPLNDILGEAEESRRHHHHPHKAQEPAPTAAAAAAAAAAASTAPAQPQQRPSKQKGRRRDVSPSDGSDSDDGKKKKQQQPADKYDTMSSKQLQNLCKKHGLSTGGSKAHLTQRLRAADAE